MNKNLIVCAVLLLAFKISYAQTEKGTQTLGLNFSASRSTNNQSFPNGSIQFVGTVTSSFDIGPSYSYFIADKLDIGGDLTYRPMNEIYTATGSADNSGYPTKYSTKNFVAEVFARKYFMYKNTIGFRTGAYFSYARGSNATIYEGTYALSSSNGSGHEQEAQLTLDLVYYPSKRLGISANIANAYYNWYKVKGTNEASTNGDNAGINFISNGLALSVFYVFGSK